ncbi:MAG TPA: alpha/beta fold hydrolase [Usitatibacter sp.]|nr:alpha/beta fold hydrolase [Usitatibacter sp.]
MAAAAAACSPGAPDESPSISLAACRLPGLDLAARCGTLEVWEDRAARSGRRITLHVAVVPARLRSREPDPIVILAGGPGQGAISLAAQVMPLFTKLNDTRDVVFLDQRGTGKSNPLNCNDDSQPLQALFEDALPERLVTRCLAELDADPRQYVTTVAMQDLDEVRGALGYAKVNLWGGSYGTRAALEYVRRYPDRVRTMVLDGVAPPSMKLPLSFATDGDAALKRLFEACDGEPLCRKVYPELRVMIQSLRSQLARRPSRATILDPRTGERADIQVNENVLLSGLFRPLYVAELASLLPLGVAAAANGDFNPLLAQNLELADDIAENLAVGMHLSVICSEDVPRVEPSDLAAAGQSFFGRSLVDDFLRACATWPHGKVPEDYYTPVRSDVPALILSGGIDPATPPRHGAQVAATLPRAKHLVAPNLGHGVSLHGCAPRLVESFIRAGSADKVDGQCLQRIPRPLFMMPLGVTR